MQNVTHYKDGKGTIQVVPKRGDTMGTCATFNRKYLCCNVKVLRSVSNCPFECSYCFLQNYLNDGPIKVVGDIDLLMTEVREEISRQPWRLFRIGTWELGDSLALEDETDQASRLIQEFSKLENALLELKTKSDRVDPILQLDHKHRTVVSWSLNTEHVIQQDEHRTAPLMNRLNAMHKVLQSGYLIGLHFDPMVCHEGWQDNYADLIGRVFEVITPEQIAWISIGSLRFNPEMKKMIENNYPESRLTSAEMVPGDDNKVRYVKPLRLAMYDFFYEELKKFIQKDNLVYLCMERWDVWDRVLGYHPRSAAHLDYLFAQSLYSRYGIFEEPQLDFYEREL